MADQVGEKTEKPSAKRLKEARERGQVAVSRDVSMALGSLAATGVLVGAGSFLLRRLTATITDSLSHFGDAPLRELRGEDLIPLVISGGTLVALTAGPVAIAAAASGVFSSVLQSGFNFSTTPLTPELDRLSPANGFKKLAPSRAGIDTIKAIITAAVLERAGVAGRETRSRSTPAVSPGRAPSRRRTVGGLTRSGCSGRPASRCSRSAASISASRSGACISR